MKLTGAAAARYLARPDPANAGLLLFGEDAMRVALKRQEAVAALIGPDGEAEMRLTRMAAGDLRKDGAALNDALRAAGFFPGMRVVLVEDAADGSAEAIGSALADWRAGDAVMVVTAGSLNARSALRKLFEDRADAVAVGIYDDPPSRDEVEAMLRHEGLGGVPPDAMGDLLDLSRMLDPGDFRQTLAKIATYKQGDATPLTPAEVAALGPATVGAEIDDLLDAAADGQTARIGPLMQRVAGQGVQAVAVCIQANRHFRTLYAAATDPGGVSAGLARARPPVFGPRRDRLQRQAQAWPAAKLEEAISLLVDTDLSLRSSSRAPALAVIERALIRLSRLAAR